MCLGGPNHCRVGRAGSQSYLLSIDRRLCMQLLVVCIVSSCCVHHRGCVLLVVGWRRRVKCVCFLCTRAHTP
jgi:hypothetical protein